MKNTLNKNKLNKYPWDKVVSFVNKNFNLKNKDKIKETKVLELGFGSGVNLWFCAREGFDCYGIESSPQAVNYACEWFQSEGLKAELRQGYFAPLDYDDNFFDLVIDRGSLTCVSFDDCLSSLNEIYRVLKPGGIFHFNPYSQSHTSFISGVFDEEKRITKIISGSLKSVGFLKFYNFEEIQDLIEKSNFTVKEIKHIEEKSYSGEKNVHSEWVLILVK
ncbi:MAG: class I SAM-dependent methyltransferase [Candidatus Caenarcaniphilales bacterium]|nr:class I SAM-dependent methyltransferase [Candidatus Caenarcaniphilales bacterium]